MNTAYSLLQTLSHLSFVLPKFSRGMVGSAGTCQPAAAARRSQARRRARPAYDAGVHRTTFSHLTCSCRLLHAPSSAPAGAVRWRVPCFSPKQRTL